MAADTTLTARTTPPFRADHVGSLLRPATLLRARDDRAAGRISAADLRAIEDDAIRDVVGMQRDVGLRSATDGEFRRTSWHMDFIYQLGGITQSDGTIRVRMHNADGDVEFTAAALKISEPIRLPKTIFADDFAFLRSIVEPGVTAKLTIPSPSMVHYRGGRAAIDPAVYPDEEQFWTDLSAAYAEQVRGVAELGGQYLQLDDTSLAYLNDPAQRAELADRGGDPEHQHLRYIKQINAALAEKPAGPDRDDAHVPGELPVIVGGRGRVRLRRRGALLRAGCRRILPGVRRRALGRLRAAALRSAGQDWSCSVW